MKIEWNNDKWTEFAVKAIKELGPNLLTVEPKDFVEFSGVKFDQLKEENKIEFYIVLLAAMAKRESGFNTNATYMENFKDANAKNVISRGLLQLSFESVKGYGFKLSKPEDLHDPETNIRAAVTIMNRWIGKDKVISSDDNRGLARYWSVIRQGKNHFYSEIKFKTTSASIDILSKEGFTIYERFYDVAKSQMGIHELPGKQHNKTILEYHKATDLKATDDETPWCSSFANWVTGQCGIVGTKSAAARSWLKWGEKLQYPVKGCIVVFSRTGGGHVSFFDHQDDKFIYCLGGNQSNAVNISAYSKDRLLGYRGV